MEILFILASCGVFLLALYVPIKDDEVFYRLINARLFTDGNELISLYPLCEESFSIKPPWLWLLPRGVEWLIYHPIENIFYIRLLGVASHLFFLALLVWVAKALLGIGNALLLLAIVALFSLDTLPFLMDINRPEQSIICGVLLLVALTLGVVKKKVIPWRIWPVLAIYLALVNYLFASHAKACLFLPLALVSAHYIGKAFASRCLAAVMAAAAVSFNIISVKAHVARSLCGADYVNPQYLSHSVLLHQPLEFFQAAIKNLWMSPVYYASPAEAPRWSGIWIPAYLNHPPTNYRLFDDEFSAGVAALYVALFFYALFQGAKAVGEFFRKKTLRPEIAIALAILLSLACVAAMQTMKLYYEGALFIPLTILSALLLTPPQWFGRRRAKQAAAALLLIGIASQANLVFKYFPYAVADNPRQHDSIKNENFMDHLMQAGLGDFEKTRDEVLAAARSCNIPTDATGQYVMTDMLTYTFFRDTFKPLSILYLSIWHSEADENHRWLFRLLKEKHSSGLITLCDATSETLRPRMTQSGAFCCLDRQSIEASP